VAELLICFAPGLLGQPVEPAAEILDFVAAAVLSPSSF
jgi:hypothetical protein